MLGEIDINYCNTFAEVNSDWKRIYERSHLSYFCSPDWHQVVLELYHATTLTKRLRKIRYFSFADEGAIAVGFFAVAKKRGKKIVEFSPLLGPSDYYDFVTGPNPQAETMRNILDRIAADHCADEIHFAHIKSDSALAKALQLFPKAEVSSLDCVAIHLPGDYDAYFASLSKSVKQNIRTAYNRLTKDGIAAHFQLYTAKDLDRIDFSQLKNMYKERNAHRAEKQIWKTRLFKLLNHPFSEEKDLFELQAVKDTDFSLGILKIQDRMAAYFFGFERNYRIEINRVVINNDFRFYSPGLLLLNEYIKKGIPGGLEKLDLTVGDEKYKYDLGGQTHRIISGKIVLQ